MKNFIITSIAVFSFGASAQTAYFAPKCKGDPQIAKLFQHFTSEESMTDVKYLKEAIGEEKNKKFTDPIELKRLEEEYDKHVKRKKEIESINKLSNRAKNYCYVRKNTKYFSFSRKNLIRMIIDNIAIKAGEYKILYKVKAEYYNCLTKDPDEKPCRESKFVKYTERVVDDTLIVKKDQNRLIVEYYLDELLKNPNEMTGEVFLRILKDNKELFSYKFNTQKDYGYHR